MYHLLTCCLTRDRIAISPTEAIYVNLYGKFECIYFKQLEIPVKPYEIVIVSMPTKKFEFDLKVAKMKNQKEKTTQQQQKNTHTHRGTIQRS